MVLKSLVISGIKLRHSTKKQMAYYSGDLNWNRNRISHHQCIIFIYKIFRNIQVNYDLKFISQFLATIILFVNILYTWMFFSSNYDDQENEFSLKSFYIDKHFILVRVH